MSSLPGPLHWGRQGACSGNAQLKTFVPFRETHAVTPLRNISTRLDTDLMTWMCFRSPCSHPSVLRAGDRFTRFFSSSFMRKTHLGSGSNLSAAAIFQPLLLFSTCFVLFAFVLLTLLIPVIISLSRDTFC